MATKKVNAFMLFAQTWKAKNQNISLQESIQAAGEVWKNMSEKEREPYKKQAASENLKAVSKSNSTEDKLTSNCISISLIEKQQIEKARRHDVMTKNIKSTIEYALEYGILKCQKFYFISVNYFGKVIHTEDYIPAEIAVVEFTLADGVQRKYHIFVKPKVNFYGNLYEVQQHAATTHQLPLPPNAFGNESLYNIFQEIMSFIRDEISHNLPPLYTHDNAIGYVRSCLNFLLNENQDMCAKMNGAFNIYSIQELFYQLKCVTSIIGKVEKPKNRFIVEALIQRDFFEFTSEIACKYHEQIDIGRYCALSQVIRYAFTFADYICSDLSITFIPGQHMPRILNTNTDMDKDKEDHINKNALTDNTCNDISPLNMSTYKSYEDCMNSSFFSTSTQSPSGKRAIKNENTFNISMNSTITNEENSMIRHDDSKILNIQFLTLDMPKYKENTLPIHNTRSAGRGIVCIDNFSENQRNYILQTDVHHKIGYDLTNINNGKHENKNTTSLPINMNQIFGRAITFSRPSCKDNENHTVKNHNADLGDNFPKDLNYKHKEDNAFIERSESENKLTNISFNAGRGISLYDSSNNVLSLGRFFSKK